MVIGAAAVALAVFLLVPQYAWAALPLLIALVCPVSMLLMMRRMNTGADPECAARAGQPASSAHDHELVRLREEIAALKRQSADNSNGEAETPGEKPGHI
ncbi:DUF2933 domain-containing protein [Allosaccharopolyspora coralli]|uniref:DUF2933 domain-containing protein n=1 Tax=Allosaccharopolyspora coralli TaxID=2665642 RepID=UPI0016523AA9|nr:DUF2933 domain-containing protein [Allosaccharopolyspora coralli]